MIKFHCEHCDQKISMPDQHAGKKARCPSCRNIFIIPDNKAESDILPINTSPSSATDNISVWEDIEMPITQEETICSKCGNEFSVTLEGNADIKLCPNCHDISNYFTWNRYKISHKNILLLSAILLFLLSILFIPYNYSKSKFFKSDSMSWDYARNMTGSEAITITHWLQEEPVEYKFLFNSPKVKLSKTAFVNKARIFIHLFIAAIIFSSLFLTLKRNFNKIQMILLWFFTCIIFLLGIYPPHKYIFDMKINPNISKQRLDNFAEQVEERIQKGEEYYDQSDILMLEAIENGGALEKSAGYSFITSPPIPDEWWISHINIVRLLFQWLVILIIGITIVSFVGESKICSISDIRDVPTTIYNFAGKNTQTIKTILPSLNELLSSQGRISRSGYFLVQLFVLPILIIIALGIDFLIYQFTGKDYLPYVTVGMQGLCIYLGTVNSIKRLHDRGRSAGFILLLIIPFVNIWVLVEVFFLKGEMGANQYGPVPIGLPFIPFKPVLALFILATFLIPYLSEDSDYALICLYAMFLLVIIYTIMRNQYFSSLMFAAIAPLSPFFGFVASEGFDNEFDFVALIQMIMVSCALASIVFGVRRLGSYIFSRK